MKRILSSIAICALVFTLTISQLACDRDLTFGLRSAFAAAPILIAALPVSANKQALGSDFTEMGNDTVTLSDDLKACAKAKPCSLTAIDKYSVSIEGVLSRPEFNINVAKLEKVKGLVRAIIASARVFFGAEAHGIMATVGVTEKSIRTQVDNLKREMSQ